jgi:hypothetical protein
LFLCPGRRRVRDPSEARELLNCTDVANVAGCRDCAMIGLMVRKKVSFYAGKITFPES